MAISQNNGQPQATSEPEPVAPILLLSLGGMIVFFASFFILIGFLAGPGFLIAGAVVGAIGLIMLLVGVRMYRRHSKEKKEAIAQAVKNARCEYCGMQNKMGDDRCDSCGAPLKY